MLASYCEHSLGMSGILSSSVCKQTRLRYGPSLQICFCFACSSIQPQIVALFLLQSHLCVIRSSSEAGIVLAIGKANAHF